MKKPAATTEIAANQPALKFPPSRIRLLDGRAATVRHWFGNGYCTYSTDGVFYDAAEQMPAVNFARIEDVEILE